MSEAGQTDETHEAPPFEVVAERLETLVKQMEEGGTSLDDLVNKYEEGVQLLQACRKRLGEAELKIRAIRERDGEVATESFESGNDEPET